MWINLNIFYVQIKDGFYECYRDIMSIHPEFRFPLMGCNVVECKLEHKPLAFKIIQGESEKVIIEVSFSTFIYKFFQLFFQSVWSQIKIEENKKMKKHRIKFISLKLNSGRELTIFDLQLGWPILLGVLRRNKIGQLEIKFG